MLPHAIAMAPDGARVYVINDYDQTIVVSTATNTVEDVWPTALVGTNPRALAVSPDNRRLYVVGNHQLFIVIDIASRSRVATITHNQGGAFGVAASPTGRAFPSWQPGRTAWWCSAPRPTPSSRGDSWTGSIPGAIRCPSLRMDVSSTCRSARTLIPTRSRSFPDSTTGGGSRHRHRRRRDDQSRPRILARRDLARRFDDLCPQLPLLRSHAPAQPVHARPHSAAPPCRAASSPRS